MNTVYDFLANKNEILAEGRKFRGKLYYPVESEYYDDGQTLTRNYICGADEPEDQGSELWATLYVMSWPHGADPEQDCFPQVEADPGRRFDLYELGDWPDLAGFSGAAGPSGSSGGFISRDEDIEIWLGQCSGACYRIFRDMGGEYAEQALKLFDWMGLDGSSNEMLFILCQIENQFDFYDQFVNYMEDSGLPRAELREFAAIIRGAAREP